jgi:hypothetical protein
MARSLLLVALKKARVVGRTSSQNVVPLENLKGLEDQMRVLESPVNGLLSMTVLVANARK